MKIALLGGLLAMFAAPAIGQKVEVAEGDWSGLPQLQTSKYITISEDAVEGIHRLVTRGECELQGASRKRIDMTVPFLIRFGENGTVEHVVLKKLGCSKAEGILARVVIDWAKNGTIKSTGENKERWYRSEISFSSES